MEANAGQPTPFLGLEERIGVSAYFLWMIVLAVALWRRPTIEQWPRRRPTYGPGHHGGIRSPRRGPR
jgi:hypothetical protein